MIQVKNVQTLGQIAKQTRKAQSLDQLTAGVLAGSGITFVSQFENGKETVQLGKVMELLDALGIEVYLSLPELDSEITISNVGDVPNSTNSKS